MRYHVINHVDTERGFRGGIGVLNPFVQTGSGQHLYRGAVIYIMPFQPVIDSLADILRQSVWVAALAGILPLSALIDFIDVRGKLHILELVGAVPLWSWAITPSGGRLLLAKQRILGSRDCLQDQFGNTVALEVLDGRYGDRYFASSPGTLRLVLGAYPSVEIENDHKNMAGEDFDLRVQTLEVVHISRRNPKIQSTPPRLRWRQVLVDSWRVASPLYLSTTLLGWALLIGTIVMSAFFETWISLAFLLLVPASGVVVSCLYGSQPRRLLVEKESEYVRLLVVTEHMNSADWLVIYGESTLVNSLLNRPLEPNGPSLPPAVAAVFRSVLRLFILGQWGLVLGAAATQNWNSYFICFWISFSIFSNAYLITPERIAESWSKSQANLKIERYNTRVSTRRALINTITALNPDTFSFDGEVGAPDMTKFNGESMNWVDPILARSSSRTTWEEATRKAMMKAHPQLMIDDLSLPKFREHPNNFLTPTWNADYSDPDRCYWRRFIPEGIYIAAKIKKVAKLPDRRVVGIDL
jgi:hypothetical protein